MNSISAIFKQGAPLKVFTLIKLLAAIGLFAASTGSAQTLLLSDNFNSASTLASTFNNTLASDQGGSLATISYTVSAPGGDWSVQHGNGGAMLVANAGGNNWASLNRDFSADANGANQPLVIQFDAWVTDGAAHSWLGFGIGPSQGTDFYSQPYGAAFTRSAGTHRYKFVISDTAGTGSAFNGVPAGATVRFYQDGVVQSVTTSTLESGDGYLTFKQDQWDGYSIGRVDNLSISVSPIYTVTYDGNVNDSGTAPTDGSSPYETGATVTVLGNTGGLAKSGLNFAGWNTAADDSGTTYTAGNTFTIISNTVLYARWVSGFTVTYSGNGNTGGSAPVDTNSYAPAASATVLGAGTLVRTGNSFANWNTAADGSGVSYLPSGTLTVNRNTLLYAQWAPNQYYIAADGNDNNAGTNQSAPWKTLSRVNTRTFLPGEQILFKAGDSWAGQLWPKGSGNASAPILLGTYGSGAKPVIDAQGASGSAAIKLYNQEYWTIQGFEVANWATNYDSRWGILVTADDGLLKRGIQILNNTVRDVYASAIRSPGANPYPSFYQVAGIYVNVAEPAHMENLLIQGNRLTNIVASGISFWGESEFVGGGVNWSNLSPGVVVRSNIVSYTAGDGILILGTDDELVEYNLVEYVSAVGTNGTDLTAGMWPTRHRNGLWQFNEVHHTKRWGGDAQGFDNDLYLQGTTIFQYNYSHDNEGGFFLDCCYPDGGQTVVRYNISVNEPMGDLRRNNALFYNNVFYSPGRPMTLTPSSGNLFANNIFWCSSLDSAFGSQLLVNNLYWGGTPLPTSDAQGILGSPGFLNPNTNGLLTGFMLASNSPAIGSGTLVSNNGGRDFFGAPVSATNAPNRGVDNSPGAAYVPAPTSLQISGPSHVQIPVAGVVTTNFVAAVRDQYQLLMSNAPVAWSLIPSYEGIQLNQQTGTLSVGSNAPVLNPAVRAQSGSLTSEVSLVISPLLYQASGDFSTTQGFRQWAYQYWTGSSYADMAWVPANNWWIGNETYLLLWSGGGHPGNDGEAALKWTAPAPGVVRVLGKVAKGDTTGGDGIIATIKQNMNTVWGPTPVAYNDAVGVTHDFTRTVQPGDAIYFLINEAAHNANDTTRWDPIVYYTVLLTPPELSVQPAGTNFSLRWPPNHLGWSLLSQTNNLNLGVSSNTNDWMRLPGSSATNSVVIPILPTAPGGYYRLVYP